MEKITLIFLLSFFFLAGCSKEEKPQVNQQQKNTEQDNSEDINLTPQEQYSTSLLTDFLDGSEDEDLANFLETEVFDKMGGSYSGSSIIELSPSTWLLCLEKDSVMKNYLIQKFVNFKTNDYYFRMKETSLTVNDVIARKRNTPTENTAE